MKYILRPMDQPAAREIAGWHYDEPYSFYDMAQDPDDLAEFLEPANWPDRYFAAYDVAERLTGFFYFGRDESGAVEIGLGMRPDLTGRGLGLAFMEAGLAFARERWGTREFTLSVAAFNQRAIRLYEKAGFQAERHFVQRTNGGEYPFVAMRRGA